MKIFFISAVILLFMQSAFAGLTVNMFTQPVTLNANNITFVDYFVDFENDGLDDVRFIVYTNGGIIFTCINSQAFEVNYVNSGEAIAYNCGAGMTATTTWDDQSGGLADNTIGSDLQFDGKGARYLAFRKYKYTSFGHKYYQYGWFKVACTQDARQLIIYGYAYSDAEVELPDIRAGEGECYSPSVIEDLILPANALTIQNFLLKVTFAQPLSLRVLDTQGRLIAEIKHDGGEKEYDFSPYPAGTYLAEVTSGNKRKTVKLHL